MRVKFYILLIEDPEDQFYLYIDNNELWSTDNAEEARARKKLVQADNPDAKIQIFYFEGPKNVNLPEAKKLILDKWNEARSLTNF